MAFCGSTTRKIDHRVDLDRDVVARDHVLRRHVHRHHAQVHAHHLLDAGNEDHQARALDLPEAAELEHDAALVFAQHAQRGGQQHDQQRHQHAAQAEVEVEAHDVGLLSVWLAESGRTSSVSPSPPEHAHRLPGAQGLGAGDAPALAMHEGPGTAAVDDEHLARRPDQFLGAADHRPPARAQRHAATQQHDGGRTRREAEDQRQRHAEARDVAVEQQQAAGDEGDEAADAERAEARAHEASAASSAMPSRISARPA